MRVLVQEILEGGQIPLYEKEQIFRDVGNVKTSGAGEHVSYAYTPAGIDCLPRLHEFVFPYWPYQSREVHCKTFSPPAVDGRPGCVRCVSQSVIFNTRKDKKQAPEP